MGKKNVIKNNSTGKEAMIERRGSTMVITPNPESETPKTETEPKAKPKTEKKPKAEPKAKKEKSPLRKITLSRTTVQVTIPSEARDAMLKFLNIRLEDLKVKRSLTIWDNKQGALVTKIVKAEGE